MARGCEVVEKKGVPPLKEKLGKKTRRKKQRLPPHPKLTSVATSASNTGMTSWYTSSTGLSLLMTLTMSGRVEE